MGIKAESGPQDGEALVGNAFSAMTEGPANLFKAEFGGADPAARIRRPIPIFAVDLERLYQSGASALRDARRTGWRYLVEHEAGLDAVDLPESEDPQPEILAGGGIADNLARSARMAERIADERVNYEPRILDLNLIGDSVLWLHDASDPGADRFVSLRGTPHALKPEAMFRRLQIEAGRKLNAMAVAGDESGG